MAELSEAYNVTNLNELIHSIDKNKLKNKKYCKRSWIRS